MSQDKRSIIAVVLSVVIFGAWQLFFAPKAPPAPPPAPIAAVPSTAPTTSVALATPVRSSMPTTPPQLDTISLNTVKVTLSSLGGVPTAWQMERFLETDKAHQGEPINVVPADLPAPLSTHFVNANFAVPAEIPYRVTGKTADSIRYEWQSPQVAIIKTYHFKDDGYTADVELTLENRSNQPLQANPVVVWPAVHPHQAGGFLQSLQGPPNVWNPVFYQGGSVTRETDLNKLKLPDNPTDSLLWVGVENRYFMSAIIPRSGSNAKVVLKTLTPPAGSEAAAESGVEMSALVVPAGGKASSQFTVYVGPKELSLLKAVGVQLEGAIDYGWFGVLALPILQLLQFFYRIFHNYGIAIIALTVLVKILLYPLTKKSMKSMKAMQILQPQLKALRAKYSGDSQRLNAETMQLFKSHKVNPMGGCLPMLLQMPIYIALYKVLWNAIELYQAPFFGFYKDLAAPDPYFVGPVLLGIAMFFQQKLTPSPSADPMQQKMMMFMPVMFTAFMLFLPSGLVLYILVNTLMGVLQQYMMTHNLRWRDMLRGKFRPRTA